MNTSTNKHNVVNRRPPLNETNKYFTNKKKDVKTDVKQKSNISFKYFPLFTADRYDNIKKTSLWKNFGKTKKLQN